MTISTQSPFDITDTFRIKIKPCMTSKHAIPCQTSQLFLMLENHQSHRINDNATLLHLWDLPNTEPHISAGISVFIGQFKLVAKGKSRVYS